MKTQRNDEKILLFTLGRGQYALESSLVDRVVSAIEITPLPKAPEIIMGIINFHGELVPVYDVRKRFRLKEKKINPDDFIIIARTASRKAALVVDTVKGVEIIKSQQKEKPDQTVPFADYLSGVVKTEDGIVLIHDLDLFLAPDEEKNLEKSINEMRTTTSKL